MPRAQTDPAAELPWPRVSDLIARRIGLHFPPQRHVDLQRGLTSAAVELGFTDAAAYAKWLLCADLKRADLHVLARHLTIGETYFFRERKAFMALRHHILPELIQRRDSDRHLRLWSAACCTGEEPYSLAIALQESLPAFKNWRITLLATDINDRFLQRAAAAVYGEWSFRDLPPQFKTRHFTSTVAGRYVLLPQIRDLVTFAPLNLAEDAFPSLTTEAHAMDVIFCRNVLMYFTPAQARNVVDKLHRVLVEGGWLVVSPSEASHVLFQDFRQVVVDGAILYQKNGARREPQAAVPASEDTSGAPLSFAESARAAAPSVSSVAPPATPGPSAPSSSPSLAEQARQLANAGRAAEALDCCDRWIASDSLDPASRYLRAVILHELGDAAQARRSLQQTLYLQPDFVLAHFTLGNLARTRGNAVEANKHFTNALDLLRTYLPEDVLPHSDGLTAGRLQQIITSLVALESDR